MAMPATINALNGVIDFPPILFNNTNCFMRNLTKALSEMQEAGSKNIPYKEMIIGTNSGINLNIKPDGVNEKYSNVELKNAAENSSYVMSGYNRKQDTYGNATVYLMLQTGWNDKEHIYDSQNNLMCSLLLGG